MQYKPKSIGALHIARVARKALELMHFDNIDAALTTADPDALAEDQLPGKSSIRVQ
jgi:hypothetical protein